MLIREKNGSYTINVNGGEISMSTRSFGMVGKTYKSTQEAFKEPDYYVAIELPKKSEYSHIWSVLGAITALGLVLAVFTHL